MFRESDMPERRLHPSYVNKPHVGLQQIAQAGHIDESGLCNNRNIQHSEQMPQPVPTSWDTFYDPSHPDADWTGQVSNKHQHKKHQHDNSAHRVAIERGEQGFYGREERQDFAHRRTMPGQNINRTTFVLGGIDEPEERYKTNYQRQATMESTKVDQLTLQKRQKPIKKIQDPAQARSQLSYTASQQGYASAANTLSDRMNDNDIPHATGGSLIGYRAPNFSGRGQSMLSGIGDKVLNTPAIAKLERPPPEASHQHSDTSRILIVDNYKRFPGYTGGRK